MAGKHPNYVQETFGHPHISITPDAYGHVVGDMDHGLADATDEEP